MNVRLHLINDSNKMMLRKPADSNAIYYSELKDSWYTPDAFRTFSIKMVIEGSIHYKISGKEMDLTAGNFFLASHQPDVKAHNDKPVKTLCIDINPHSFAEAHALLSKNTDKPLADYTASNFEYPHFPDAFYSVHENELGKKLLAIANKIVAYKENPTVISAETFYEILEQIIIIENDYRLTINNLLSVKDRTRKEIIHRLKKGKSFIEENFMRNPQIPEIARACSMSEFHFYRCFKQAFNITPYRYTLKKRLQYSKELLRKEIPVNKIAFMCGFPDSRTYSKAFTRQYGKSPSRYYAAETSLFY